MKARTIILSVILIVLAALAISGAALSQEGTGLPPILAPASADALSSGFTYQGQLEKSGQLLNGSCDFQFSLYSALTEGTKLGNTQTIGNVTLKNGRFTIVLNAGGEFGSSAFNGDNRWLQVAVRCPAGSGTYVTLNPRQQLTAIPYALNADKLDNHDTSYFATSSHTHLGQSWTGNEQPLAISGTYDAYTTNVSTLIDPGAAEGAPLILKNDLNTVVCGGPTEDPCDGGIALRVLDGAHGVYIDEAGNSGITVAHSKGNGININSTAGTGLYIGEAGGGSGIYVGDADYYGVTGWSVMDSDECCYPVGVEGYGYNYSTTGGIYAYGVYGFAYRDGATNGGQARGVYGSASANNGAVAYAGYFSGDVNVTGNVLATAAGSKIDHPLDPANQYLYHAAVEAPEMTNIHNGNVILDAKGEAWVSLPAWFEAVNTEHRYQLTPIGAPGPNLYIAEKIRDNRFKIAGGEPGLEVSWQVTSLRNDPYAQDHRLPLEQAKPAEELGTYLYPEGYGMPEELGLEAIEQQAMDLQREMALPSEEASDEPTP